MTCAQLLWTPGFLTIATIRKVFCLRKQPTFFVANTGFRARWRLRISEPLTYHCPDLTSASDWLNQNFPAARPIRSTYLKVLRIVHQTYRGESVVASRNVGCFPRLKCILLLDGNSERRTRLRVNQIYHGETDTLYVLFTLSHHSNCARQEEPAILISRMLLRMRRMYVTSIRLDFH